MWKNKSLKSNIYKSIIIFCKKSISASEKIIWRLEDNIEEVFLNLKLMKKDNEQNRCRKIGYLKNDLEVPIFH